MSLHLSLKELTCIYDKRKTDGIDKINLSIEKGTVFSIIGPSGSGKTTILKCIQGLVESYSGEIIFHEETKISYLDQYIELPLKQSVKEYLANVIDDGKNSIDQIINQVRTTLSQLDMTNEIDSKIEKLSGGQKQRLIIAKSLITNPTLLLLDEPFSNLDNILRKQLLTELFEFFKEQDLTIIWVTHNTDEALCFSDSMALLNFGKLQQVGSPKNLYQKPLNLFTAQFFTDSNLIPTKLESFTDQTISFSLFGQKTTITRPDNFKINKEHENQDILLVIHPENINIISKGVMSAKILAQHFKGALTRVEFQHQDFLLIADVSSNSKLLDQTHTNFEILVDNIHCLSQI